MKSAHLARLAVLLLALLASACGGRDRLNVVLITMDTTRADHLGCYGHKGIETPNIDSLAARGTLYENAYSAAPITLPAHTSMMTGRYPVHHGVRENGGFYVPPSATTLAEILSADGYDTAAFVGAFPLDSQTGIDQGFDLYDDNYPSSLEQGKHPQLRRFFDERPATAVTQAALGWLSARERSKQPFFLWAHYFDPHQPLLPPSPHKERYPNAPYDAEIAAVDESIGRLLAWLEEQQLDDSTLVILTADHGEGLGDHGEATHALLLHSSTLHVPLIVKDPTAGPKRRLKSTVTTVDIFATVLDRLGLPVPDNQGLPLPRTDDEAPPERVVYSETLLGYLIYGWSPLERLTVSSGVRAPKVLISGPSQALYDRENDPGETGDLSTSSPAEFDALRRDLRRTKATLAQGGTRFSSGTPSPEVQARLAALGYLSSGSAPTKRSDAVDPTLPDPHTMLEVFGLHNEGSGFNEAGRFELAAALLTRAERLDPNNPAVLRDLVQTYLGLGTLDSSQRILNRLLAIDPNDIRTLLLLARHHQFRGELKQAIDLTQAAADLDQADGATRLLLAYLLEDADRLQEAEDAYRRVLESDANNTPAGNALATLLYRQNRATEAIALLEDVLARQPFFAPAWLNLGVIEYGLGDLERAHELARRALKLRPDYPQALELLERTGARGLD